MSVDEIVAHYIHANRLTHPEDIQVMREQVVEIVTMYEAPKRWVDAEVKRRHSNPPNEACC